VKEVNQPQGHSTSGSHERYKNEERLAWEAEFDCLKQMTKWLVSNGFATEDELDAISNQAKNEVLEGKKAAWNEFISPLKAEQTELVSLLRDIAKTSQSSSYIDQLTNELASIKEPIRKDLLSTARKILRKLVSESEKNTLSKWIKDATATIQPKFSSHLYSVSQNNIHTVNEVLPEVDENAADVDARLVLRDNFDALFTKFPEVLVFGEDAGNIGDVNQGLEGMQEKYGELRVADVGIREATIIGQGIGMAMRGLRPIAEIQYLDYLLYGIQIMSDDLATLHYRTSGRQKAP
jgi:flagellar biosynthesis/type III secretory pathway protein FliH